MVDRFDSYFPGRIIDQPQDDGGSTVYVSTDNGWTNDDESDAGDSIPPGHTAPALTHSGSPNLIDFDLSDGGDILDGSDLTEKLTDVKDQQSDLRRTETTLKEVQSLALGLHSKIRSENNLDPASAEITPSSSWSFAGDQASTPSSSPSSYADARESRSSLDDLTSSLQARVKQLEYDHETLKRENDRLDNINESLRYKAEKSEATIEKLRAQLSEAELLRCRAQKYTSGISERNKLDQELMSELHEDLEYNKTQLEGFRVKYDMVVHNQEALQKRLQELQTGLLNAVERNKIYEAFLRSFITDHPQHTATFETIGISPRSATWNNCATEIGEAELLISFEETSPAPTTDPRPLQSDLSDMATSLLDFQSQSRCLTIDTATFKRGCDHQDSQQASQQVLTQLPEQPRLLPAETSQLQESHNVNVDALKWNMDCDDIWESPLQRERALRNNQRATEARQHSQTPGMFLYGIRYIRNQSNQTLTAGTGFPDVASRIIIMTGLPDEVHIQRVLEHVRGGRIFNAHTASMGTGDFSYNHAYIEFAATEDACKFYRYSCSREFGFVIQDGTSVRVRISFPATDSYPLNKSMQASIDEGSTRCLAIAGFPVMHLEPILKSVGMAHSYTKAITHFDCLDDGSFEISFSSLKSAILVRKCILESSLWTCPADKRGMTFRPDPCDAPLEDLQNSFLPTYPTFDFSIFAPENAQLFMTTEEPEAEEERRQGQIFEGCDPNDPDTVGLKEMLDRKNIAWEKTADWDNAVEYMAYDPDQRKEVLHRRDRESGAVQVWYHGGWAMDKIESWKAWEHHNIDSTHPYTQKTADLLYYVTGWVDRRKVNLYLKSKAEREEDKKNGTDKNVDRSSSMMAVFKETLNSR
ncbi:t-complex protein 1 subunit beta [Colletotrichum incanum]|nr:t-complex protein 1 subunit beta [Colletotrichum incanum]